MYKAYQNHVQNHTLDDVYEAHRDGTDCPLRYRDDPSKTVPLFEFQPVYPGDGLRRFGSFGSFGSSPLNYDFTFAKIQVDYKHFNGNQRYCKFSKTPDDDTFVMNLWLEIDNPNDCSLNDLVANIEMNCSNSRVERYGSSDLESEINTLCYLFKYECISYKDHKIYVPLVFPYNVPIFLNSHHTFSISVTPANETQDKPSDVLFDVYGSVCNVSSFPTLKDTNSMTHDIFSLYYEHQYTGPDVLPKCTLLECTEPHVGVPKNMVRRDTVNGMNHYSTTTVVSDGKIVSTVTELMICFNHPCYLFYVTGLVKDTLLAVDIVLRKRDYSKFKYRPDYVETDWEVINTRYIESSILPFREVEWIQVGGKDVLLLWFAAPASDMVSNPAFLNYENIQDSVNFNHPLIDTAFLRIKHTPLTEPMPINIFAVNANFLHQSQGMVGFKYGH